MPYKDAARQRAANKAAQARLRARRKEAGMGRDIIGNTDTGGWLDKSQAALQMNLAEGEQGGNWLQHDAAEALGIDLTDDSLSDLGQVAQQAASEQGKCSNA